MTGLSHPSVLKKIKEKTEGKNGCAGLGWLGRCRAAAWLWASGAAQLGWCPPLLSFFLCYFFSYFLFYDLFYNSSIWIPNAFKQVSKFL
jgi:hypothetical protein